MQESVEITVSGPKFLNTTPHPVTQFSDIYLKNLTQQVRDNPKHYSFPLSEVPQVHARMMPAIARGSFNKDGQAIKLTCKELGIPYTYAGIKNYITKGETSDAGVQ